MSSFCIKKLTIYFTCKNPSTCSAPFGRNSIKIAFTVHRVSKLPHNNYRSKTIHIQLQQRSRVVFKKEAAILRWCRRHRREDAKVVIKTITSNSSDATPRRVNTLSAARQQTYVHVARVFLSLLSAVFSHHNSQIDKNWWILIILSTTQVTPF